MQSVYVIFRRFEISIIVNRQWYLFLEQNWFCSCINDKENWIRRTVTHMVCCFIYSMTVTEHLWFYSQLKGLSLQETTNEINPMISDIGLGHRKHAFPHMLSGMVCYWFVMDNGTKFFLIWYWEWGIHKQISIHILTDCHIIFRETYLCPKSNTYSVFIMDLHTSS